jgi:hypothetical protein
LKERSAERGIEGAILSEPVLAEEWLAPEEDEGRGVGRFVKGDVVVVPFKISYL